MSPQHGANAMRPESEPPAVSIEASGLWAKRPIRAILFDLDGTLYSQTPVRLLMALELLALVITNRSDLPVRTIWRGLAAYRRAQEELRGGDRADQDVGELAFLQAARTIGADRGRVEQLVSEWMFQRPLKYLRLSRRWGLEELLAFLAQQGIAAGVLSDYPVAAKLSALGLSDRFSIALCTADPDINAFKPHPRGFYRACELWGLSPMEVLYVGDRPEVDAVGAAAAGMSCAILSWRGYFNGRRPARSGYLATPSISGLKDSLHSRR